MINLEKQGILIIIKNKGQFQTLNNKKKNQGLNRILGSYNGSLKNMTMEKHKETLKILSNVYMLSAQY